MTDKKNKVEKNNDKVAEQPIVGINAQYVKNLSFENPNAPQGFMQQGSQPKVDISLDLEAKEVNSETYEITIQISAKTMSDNNVLFIAELAYAGLFTVKNIPDNQKDLVLLIHCPTILFPFARRVMAEVTRDGGFQPLMIDPIDFGALYQQRAQQQATTSS